MIKDSTNTDYDEDEISLLGVFRFFQRQWRVIGGVTIVIAAITSSISLTRPSSYQRLVILQVINSPLLLTIFGASTDIDRPEIANASQTGAWTFRMLRQLELSPATPTVKYDDTTKQVTLALVSTEPQQLNAMPVSSVLTDLAEQWQMPLQQAIINRAYQLEVQQQQAEQILSQLDVAIGQLSPSNPLRQEALEAQRAIVVRTQAELTFQANYLSELENNLEQASRELLPVRIVTEEKAEKQQRPPLQTPIIALIAGFTVAMVVASLVDQWQEEIANHETQTPVTPQ